MAESAEDWTTNSNDAIRISLLTPGNGGPTTLHAFQPKMTYSIFGDEEQIFGYKGLKINLRYNTSDMRPNLQIMYNKKFKAVGDTEPTDVKAVLEDFLPKAAFDKSNTFEATISSPDNAKWSPPGELWQSIESEGNTFEIWKGNLADLAVQQLLKRVQIFVPFFIEGGTYIDLEEAEWSLDRWTVFFLYQKRADAQAPVSPFTFMGYCTVFRYFYFQKQIDSAAENQTQRAKYLETLDFNPSAPDLDLETSLCRSRISQFIILPPFQGGGNGSRFYNSIFDFYLQNKPTVEITVEDPNEAFDDLRDLNDLARLRKNPAFTDLKINTTVQISKRGPAPRNIVDSSSLESVRISMKIAPRQFHRVTELHLLSRIPLGVRQTLIQQKPTISGAELKEKEQEYRLWLLWVKTRLYRHNKDMLIQLDRVERIEKLDQALGAVEAEYARLLREFEGRWKKKEPSKEVADADAAAASSSSLQLPVGSKRPSVAPESEEEDEENVPATKKIRFS